MIIAGIVGWIVNLVLYGIMRFIQGWESKTKRIPARTEKFLYLQDFNTNGWGDLLGISIIDIGVSGIVFQTWEINPLVSASFAAMAFAIGIAATIGFAYMCVKPNHKPDWGYPESGKISWGGKFHLFYFGLQVAYGVLGILLAGKIAIDGSFDAIFIPLAVGIGGLLIYTFAFILDVKQGNFAPVSNEEVYSAE